ncbi:MAG: hypothetical protein R2761_18205 [Acidimicrobiales bacterium]
MLQEQDRQLLQDDLPFAPVAPPAAMEVPWLERALEAGNRWRRPLTAVFGVMIATAAFFAYQSQRSSEQEATGPTGSRGDGVAAMVDGIQPGRIEPSTTVGVAPLGQSTEPTVTTAPPAAPTTASTARSTTTARRSATTARRPTSSPASGSGGASGSSTAPTSGGASSSTSAPAATPSTAAPPSSTPTTPPTTASTTASTAAKAVYIGDRVSFDDWDGAAAKGVTVTLWSDANRDGREESVRATATTSDSGAYGFNVEPGCYVITFGVPSGQSVLKGDQRKALCLGSGQSDSRVDLVISRPVTVRAPTSCVVNVGRFTGSVEVRDSSGTFAPSYGFYDSSGKLVVSTAKLGSPSSGRTSRTWSARGFDEGTVVSVAAEDGKGNSSNAVTCSRQNVF